MGLSKAKGKRRKRKVFLERRLGLVVVCFGLCALSFQPAKAQTFSEWFEQGKTLIKYLGQQIAYLNTYQMGVRQGYNDLKSDWGLIGSFKNGELGLHTDYFASLKQVGPEVKASAGLDDIQPEVEAIGQQFSKVSGLSGLSSAELAYAQSVGANVMVLCDRDLDELAEVLSAGALSMTGGERRAKLKSIAASVREKYVFACWFCGSVRLLSAQRLRDGQEASGLNEVYGISQ